MTDITTEVIYVDSAKAEELLAGNTHNRPISEAHVKKLAAAMKAGNFHFTAEPLKWDTNGTLLDGQHRLWALALTPGVTLKFLAVYDLPTDSQVHMDQGRVRTAADQTQMLGLVSGGTKGNTVVSAIRSYLIWETGALFRDRIHIETVAGRTQVVEWAAANPIAVKWMEEQITQNLKRVKVRQGLLLAILFKFQQDSPDHAGEFFHALFTGAGLEEGNPILTLRERLTRDAQAKVRNTERDTIGMFIQAWNAWRRGAKLGKIQRPAGGTWTAENFPELRP